ncbi:WD repeat-containing protein jip5 [Dispira parvispora]|uniref:WD repeat-containing protein JIP5 n=1 Tax=Dispira parvispora TaxID=1520584 RepID=A0A9W8E8K6_9FUNG|nr:WD repeat-containing protein jip5 [Dispira parvispora]
MSDELNRYVKGSVHFPCPPTDATFHPSENLLATGLFTGEVSIRKCYPHQRKGSQFVSSVKQELVFDTRPQKKSCRGLSFHPGGTQLFSISRDKSWVCMDVTRSGDIVHTYEKAHEASPTHIRALNHNLFMTGDDEGLVRLWDLRSQKAVKDYTHHFDYISDTNFVESKNTLLVTAGDGHLSILDIRKKQPLAICEDQEDELLSVVPMKHNKKAVVGFQTGVLGLFSWNNWGDVTDRFPGHPDSVDSLCKIDEDTLCTGGGDGIIRIVSILPNRLVGVIGVHGKYPIEKLNRSADGQLLVSVSHDHNVKLWCPQNLLGDDSSDSDLSETDRPELDEPLVSTIPTSEPIVPTFTKAQPKETVESLNLTPEEKELVRKKLLKVIGAKKKPPPQIMAALIKRIGMEVQEERLKKEAKKKQQPQVSQQDDKVLSPSTSTVDTVKETDQNSVQPASNATKPTHSRSETDSWSEDSDSDSQSQSKKKKKKKRQRQKNAIRQGTRQLMKKKSTFYDGL